MDLTGKSSLIQNLIDERDWLRQRVQELEAQLRTQDERHAEERRDFLDRLRPKPGSAPTEVAQAGKNRASTRFLSDPGIPRPAVPETIQSDLEDAIARHLKIVASPQPDQEH